MYPPIHIPTHSCMHPSMRPPMHPRMHPCIHPPIHPFIHVCIHACIHACIHVCILSSSHSFIHPFIHRSTHSSNHPSPLKDIEKPAAVIYRSPVRSDVLMRDRLHTLSLNLGTCERDSISSEALTNDSQTARLADSKWVTRHRPLAATRVNRRTPRMRRTTNSPIIKVIVICKVQLLCSSNWIISKV